MQVNLAAQMNWSCQKVAGRHKHTPATGAIACGDSLLNGLAAVLNSITDGTILRYIEVPLGKPGRTDARKD
jgi:hypothetical protein